MTTAVEVHEDLSSLAWRSRVTNRLQVWYSATVVYDFFITSSGSSVSYSKSTDAGATWAAGVSLLTPGTYIDMDIYYERWHNTANDPIVHVVAQDDAGSRGLYYNNIDLSTDTKQTSDGTLIKAGGAEPNGGPVSCGMARNGDLMLIYHAVAVSPFRSCHLSTDGGSTFIEVDHFDQSLRDNVVVWPDGASADTADMTAIYTDSSENNLKAIQWDDSAALWVSETVIDSDIGSAPGSIGAFFASAYKRSTGTVMLANAQSDGSTTTIYTWTLLGLTATAKTSVVESVTGIAAIALTVTAAGDVYCFYARDLAGGNAHKVYYKKSTDNMATWGAETAYSTKDGHVIEQVHSDPSPNLNILAPSYLFSVSLPDGSELFIESPPISESTAVLTANIPLVFTLSGTLTGATSSVPPIMLKCAPTDGFSVINVASVDSRN